VGRDVRLEGAREPLAVSVIDQSVVEHAQHLRGVQRGVPLRSAESSTMHHQATIHHQTTSLRVSKAA